MTRKLTVMVSALLMLIIFGSCVTSTDDRLSEMEIKRLIEQAIRESNQNYLNEAEIRQLIEQIIKDHDSNPISEEQIKSIIEQIIRENDLNTLTEAEIKQLIEQAIKDNNDKLEFTQWKIVQIQVKKSDWRWNNIKEEWEAFADLPELTEFIYENGAQLGYIFLGEQGVDEVQKMLPYEDTYYAGDDDSGKPITFTETISCDFQLGNPSTVGFFIKASDLYKDPDAPQNYYFRIVLIW